MYIYNNSVNYENSQLYIYVYFGFEPDMSHAQCSAKRRCWASFRSTSCDLMCYPSIKMQTKYMSLPKSKIVLFLLYFIIIIYMILVQYCYGSVVDDL